MINLYSVTNSNYTKNGDATLQPIRCELKLSINGGWSLELEVPYDKEEKWKLITEGATVRVDLDCVREFTYAQGQSKSPQRFRIYDYRKTLTSVVAIAYPMAMESTQDALIDNVVMQNKTGSQAMAMLQAFTDKYTLYTDITATGSSSMSNVNLNYAIASGASGSFIDVWGGEIVYDNLNYKVLSRIGSNNKDTHPVIYGRNMTGIQYEKNDSGLVTRIYPISTDGVRLNGTGYVDSSIASQYPYYHKRYMTAPYQLVIDDPTNPSATAQACYTAFQTVFAQAKTLSVSAMIHAVSAVGDGIPYGAIKKYKSDVAEAVAEFATENIYHSTLKSKMQTYIKNGINDKVAGMMSVPEPSYSWHGDYDDGWWYGDNDTFWATNKAYARNEYQYISKKWSSFDDDGLWEAPKDDTGAWDWYQPQAPAGSGVIYGVRYGNFDRYLAKNEWIYITDNGTLTAYWIDSDGYYDPDETVASTWTWHGSGAAGDPWWFGAADASSEDDYAHDQWVFIDGTLYYFDNNGYYDGQTKMDDYQWDWCVSGNKYWFGNAENHEYAAIYLKSQWAKIGSDYYYFDADGYVVDEETMIAMITSAFLTQMASLKTTVNAQKDILYALLYQLMTSWANSQYSDNHIDLPQVTIAVDMIDLSRTNEYKNYQQLERICLGDTVDCRDSLHGITSEERVIALTYDCIRGYNTAVTIGHTEASLGSVLSSGSSGSSVPSGFDTSAIESALTTQGNSIAALQTNKQDKLTAGDNITIVNNRISATGGAGLQYWHETATRFYREGVHDGLYADDCIETSLTWENYVAGLINGYEYEKLNDEPAMFGEFGYGLNKKIVIVALTENATKWKYRSRESTDNWTPMSNYPSDMWNVSFTYNSITWYASIIGVLNGTSSTGTVTNIEYIDTTVMATNDDAGAIVLAKHFIDVENATDEIDVITEIGTQSYAFKYGNDDDTFTYIDTDGNALFNEITTKDGTLSSQMGAKQDKLIAGSNVQIGADGKTISATDTTYTAGDNISITSGVISTPNEVLIGDSVPSASLGENGNTYYKYTNNSETVEEEITVPTLVDDQATHITITDFDNYTKLKFNILDNNGNPRTITKVIADLPQNNDPQWGTYGDIWISNSYFYLCASRDSTGIWLKQCGNVLQELFACYEVPDYEIAENYVKVGDEWHKFVAGGGGGGGRLTLLASPPSGSTSFPLNTNITLSDNINNYDLIMFCPAYYANPASMAFPPTAYPVSYFKALTDRAFTYYGGGGYNDVRYINDTTVMFLRNGGETVCNAIYGIKL